VNNPIEVYVVALGDDFCRFGSYRTFTLVDHPLKGTIYRRKSDAENRANDKHYHRHIGTRQLVVKTIKATAEVI